MKIAYIFNIFPRLYHTFILNDIIHLVNKGIDVLIFSINKSRETVINEGAYNLKDKTNYFEDFLGGKKGNLAKYIKEIAARLERDNLLYKATGNFLFKIDKNDNIIDNFIKDFGWNVYAFNQIATKIKQQNVDIIHGAFSEREATAAMILSEITGIPFTFETHARDLFVNFQYDREKIKKTKKIFTISYYNKNYLVNDLQCPASKIIVKRVSFNKGHCDQISEKPKKEDLILSVCRLDPIKGLEYAIDAFSLVTQKRNDLRFIIIGDGPLRDHLKKKVDRLSLGNKVFFLGNISNERALDFIAQATIFLLPSVIASNGDRDGIPTSLIEAMYLRTPVISSKVSGIPELVDDGVNGFLTEPADVNQITEKIDKLLLSKSLRIRMGEEARKKVIKEFNIEENLKKLIDAWEEISS